MAHLCRRRAPYDGALFRGEACPVSERSSLGLSGDHRALIGRSHCRCRRQHGRHCGASSLTRSRLRLLLMNTWNKAFCSLRSKEGFS